MKSDMDTALLEEAHDLLVTFFRLGFADGAEGSNPRTVTADEVLHSFSDVTPAVARVFRAWCGYAAKVYMRGFRKGHAEWVSSKKRRPLHRRKIEDDGRNVEVNSGTQL